jgi:Fe-S oxidoreductase
LALLPQFFNWWMRRAWVRYVMQHWVGIVDIPPVATLDLRRELQRRDATVLTEAVESHLRTLPRGERSQFVILLQDAFTTFYEPKVLLATYDLMVKMGLKPLVVPYFPNGKALVIKGFLGAFRVLARRNAQRLNRLAELEIPMVGVEPAVVLTYRDEYPELLGSEAIQFRVELLQDWLAAESNRLSALATSQGAESAPPILFGHCTERTAAPLSQKTWSRVFEAVGLRLETPAVGCCGMCGVFGHEAAHVEESKGVYAMSWQPKILAAQQRTCLATGHSCRSQVHRTDHIELRHPVELLLEHVTL